MSLQTAFISMRNISHTCTQLGRLIEQHMFIDACMVFELGTQYVHIIEQKVEEQLNTSEHSFSETKESVSFYKKMAWIKEMYKQDYREELSLTTFDMIQCYRFLLEITHYYIHTYENKASEIPYATELTNIVQKDCFMKNNYLWQHLSHQPNANTIAHKQTMKNGTTITYKNSMIYIPNDKLSTKLKHLEIKGCNHFLRELERIHIYTLKDLPKQMDFIYLQLSGVGPSSVKKLWNQLCALFSNKVTTPQTREQINEERMLLLSGESIELPKEIASLPIQKRDFPGSERAIESIREHGIHTFGQLPTHLLELKNLPGIGRIRVRHLFNQIRELIPRLEDEQVLLELTNDERILYENEQYVEWIIHVEENEQFAKQEKIPARFIRIAKKRYESLLDNKHVTLQELGDFEGITRERVRQILHRGKKLVAQKWKTYIECVNLKLDEEGSILINDQLFSEAFSNYVMIQALEVKGIYYHELHDIRILTRLDEDSFTRCLQTMKERAHTYFDLTVIDEELLHNFCTEQAETYKLPLQLVEEVVSSWINWMNYGKGILKNISKAKVVEMIMLDYPDGVAIYKEEEKLNQKANQYMPGKFVRQRDFTAVFSRGEVSHILLLWARGVYIHRTFIQAEESWVRDIQHKAHTMLLKKQFIHVRKLYEAIEKEAVQQHIPNEYALFSLMRLYDEKLLSLERFPMIQLQGEQRIDNAQRVIHYIQEENGRVTKSELMNEFVKKRGFKPFTIEQILSDSGEIISYDQHSYTLLSYYDEIQDEALKPIFATLANMLQNHMVVSVHTLYASVQNLAKELTIETPYVLYAILQRWNESTAYFDRFPYILSDDTSNESINNRVLIEEYIAGKQAVVKRKDIIQWLSTISEAGESTLDFALNSSEQILYYKRGQYGEYVHRDTIGLDAEKEKLLFREVENVYKKLKQETNNEYMLLRDVYRQIELPPLSKGIKWNDVLLADLIKASDKWHIFGSYDEIYMPKHLPYNNDIDFIEYVIMHEFNGVLSLSSLRLFLSEIRYSSTGDFRVFVQRSLLKNEAPFVLENEMIIHKSQLEDVRAMVDSIF